MTDQDQVTGAGLGQSVTIYDIARSTGYSASTVSRALHKPGRISVATERKIREAADRLGYRINPSARALQTGRTGMIGLVVSDITNPVFFDLIRGAERVATEAGVGVVLTETGLDAERELDAVRRLLPSVDGLVLVASRLADDQIHDLAGRKQLVLANRVLDGVMHVVPDNTAAVHAALDHLASLGHRSLAFLAGPSSSWISEARWDRLLVEAPRRGMSIVEIGPAPGTVEGGRASLRRVLASGVTAVHTYNDLMAIGLLIECHESGVDVPGQLSIVGNDDIFGADFVSPALTTLRSPLDKIGEEAVRLLLDAQESGEPSAEPERLPLEFVRRATTGPAPDRL